ncbi:MAG: hypothetical protein FD152_1666 [Xanthobacteraceae bacterium]|nr:MAG: hypothetical protein FD152_1666 [Xanthobacteraceae bacterium]
MKGDAMNDADERRRLSPLARVLTAIAGVGGGLMLAIYSFIQLRTAWIDGVFQFGGRSRPALDVDYDSEPLSYIVAMSALYPTAIVCGIGVAIFSVIVLLRGRSVDRKDRGTR